MTRTKHAALWLPILLACGCGNGETPRSLTLAETLDVAIQTTGPEFAEHRDDLLNRDRSSLNALLVERGEDETSSWTQRHHRDVLEAWLLHEEEYRRLLDAPKVVDASGRSSFEWVFYPAPELLRAAPLMRELLLDGTLGLDAQTDAITALLHIAATADDRAATIAPDLILEGLNGNRGLDERTRRFAARVLGGLPSPPASLNDGDALVKALAWEVGHGGEQDVARHLLDVATRIGRQADKATQASLVAALDDEDLVSFVGPSYYWERIARVGNADAYVKVVAHLRRSTETADHTWGVLAVRDMAFSPLAVMYLYDVLKGGTHVFRPTELQRELAMASYRAQASRLDATDPDGAQQLEGMVALLGKIPDEAFPAGSPLRDDFAALCSDLADAVNHD